MAEVKVSDVIEETPSTAEELNVIKLLDHHSFSDLTSERLLFTHGSDFGLEFTLGKQQVKLFGCPLQMVKRSNFIAALAQSSDFFKKDEPRHLAVDLELDEDRLVALLHVWLALNSLTEKTPRNLNTIQALFLLEWCNYFDIEFKSDFTYYCTSASSELTNILRGGKCSSELKKLTPAGHSALLRRFDHEKRLFLNFRWTSDFDHLQNLLEVKEDDDVRVTREIMRSVNGFYRGTGNCFEGSHNTEIIARAQSGVKLHRQELKYLQMTFNTHIRAIEEVSKLIGTDNFFSKLMEMCKDHPIYETERIATVLKLELPPVFTKVQREQRRVLDREWI